MASFRLALSRVILLFVVGGGGLKLSEKTLLPGFLLSSNVLVETTMHPQQSATKPGSVSDVVLELWC